MGKPILKWLDILCICLPRRGDDRPESLLTIRRAVILAAPPSWFGVMANRDVWHYFHGTYSALASTFDVTLAELHLSEQ